MDGLDCPVGPEDRDGVVQGDEPDRTARQPARQRRAERRRHSGDPTLDREAGLLEHITEVADALALLVGELGMLVDEAVRRERDVALRFDRSQNARVVHAAALDRRNRERQSAPRRSRKPPTGEASAAGS